VGGKILDGRSARMRGCGAKERDMGNGEIDLPNPMDDGGESSPISNDELLSQLAGKEIERLLAEVDQQLDAAMDAVAEEDPSPALALRKYPRPELRRLSGQEQGLARVFNRREDRREVEIGELTDEEDPEELVGTPVVVFERVTGVRAAEDQAQDDGVNLFPDYQQPMPAALKPLQWINAPIDGMSHAALSALGKVAIVSFVSAVAMLVYVVVLTRAL
jgi:hypothetical protein